MKKFIGLTGYTLIIAAQILSASAYADNDLPVIISKNLHVQDHEEEHSLERRGVKWLEADYAKDSKNKMSHDDSNQFVAIAHSDKRCVRQQVEQIKRVSKIVRGLDYQVVINIESDKNRRESFASARTEQDYCLFSHAVNSRKILELGVIVPYSGTKSDCVIVNETAIVQALNQAKPSSCEKKSEEVQAKAVTNRSGDKVRAPASFGGQGTSEPGMSYGSGSLH